MMSSDGAMDFEALVYGKPHPSTLQFMQNSIANVTQTVSAASQAFYQKAQDVYEFFNGHEAMRRARAAVNKAGHAFTADDVRYLQSLASIQNAKPQMTRFIMSEPVVRQMWLDQQIEGYDGQYLDTEPGCIGDTHTEYARTMQGMIVDGDDGVSHYSLYYGLEHPDELELDIEEQVDIMNTWDRVRHYLDRGEQDPTSVWGSML